MTAVDVVDLAPSTVTVCVATGATVTVTLDDTAGAIWVVWPDPWSYEVVHMVMVDFVALTADAPKRAKARERLSFIVGVS